MLAKLLENTLDESSKLKNMSNKRLRYLTKSPLSQNFYLTMSDLSKTFILDPAIHNIQSNSKANSNKKREKKIKIIQ